MTQLRTIASICLGLSTLWYVYCVRWGNPGRGGQSDRVSRRTWRLAQVSLFASAALFMIANMVSVYSNL